jgi:hypothetical protein
MLSNSLIVQGHHAMRKNYLLKYGIFFIHFTLSHDDERVLLNHSK